MRPSTKPVGATTSEQNGAVTTTKRPIRSTVAAAMNAPIPSASARRTIMSSTAAVSTSSKTSIPTTTTSTRSTIGSRPVPTTTNVSTAPTRRVQSSTLLSSFPRATTSMNKAATTNNNNAPLSSSKSGNGAHNNNITTSTTTTTTNVPYSSIRSSSILTKHSANRSSSCGSISKVNNPATTTTTTTDDMKSTTSQLKPRVSRTNNNVVRSSSVQNITPVLLPISELSDEARSLLDEIQHLEKDQIHEKYGQIERECILLYETLGKELNITSTTTNLTNDTVLDYKARLEAISSSYSSSIDQIQVKYDEYNTNFARTLETNKEEHSKQITSIKLRSETDLNDLTQRVDNLISEGKQIAVDKLTLTKGISLLKALINKRNAELERLTKDLTPQQKLTVLELGKQIMAITRKRDLFESSKHDQLTKKREFDEQTEQFIAAELYRRQLHNLLQEIRGSIRVLCRIRPLMAHDGESEYKTLRYEQEVSQLKLSLKEKEHVYSFDTILGPDSTQTDVFEEVNGVVQSAIDGYDVCLFSYGLTGSGKSWTMSGDLQSDSGKGIIPRSVELIFDKTHELSQQGWDFNISVSCCQIYQEKIHDLLASKNSEKNDLKIINDQVNKKIIVSDLQVKSVTCVNDVHNVLTVATRNRTVAQTSMNAQSSRSHFIFTLHITMVNTRTNERRVGNLNLCDLAGSERVNNAKTTGEQFKETQKINLSLSTLNRVFLELASDNDHIPFRDSKLTDLLQYCLSGNGKTMMIVNLSPASISAQETNSSLQLAKTVSMIQKGKSKGGPSKQITKASTTHGVVRNHTTMMSQPSLSSSSSSSKGQSLLHHSNGNDGHDDDGDDDDNNNSNAQYSQKNSNYAIKSPHNDKKRVCLRSSRLHLGTTSSSGGDDNDVDNQLVCLDEYMYSPPSFEIDPNEIEALSAGPELIEKLQAIMTDIDLDIELLNTTATSLKTSLDTAKDLLPSIQSKDGKEMFQLDTTTMTSSSSSSSSSMNNFDVVPNNFINTHNALESLTLNLSQPRITFTLTQQFDHLKEKLSSLRQSVQSSTLELSRKGQALQLTSLQIELESHRRQIESTLMAAQHYIMILTQTSNVIDTNFNLPLGHILDELRLLDNNFKKEYQDISALFTSKFTQLHTDYLSEINLEREHATEELQRNQRELKNLYSTKYLAEIKALEKTTKLYEDVKQQHDELKMQHDLLDGQVKGLDFLKEIKNGTMTFEQYIVQQQAQLQGKKDELVLLEQECTSYNDELLAERRSKLSRYRHHNQQLEMKIASLGGSNALMALLVNPKQTKSVQTPHHHNQQQQQQQSNNNAITTTTTTSTNTTKQHPTQNNLTNTQKATTPAQSLLSKPPTSQTRALSKASSNTIVTNRPTLATNNGRAIPTSSTLSKPSTINTAATSLSRVVPNNTVPTRATVANRR